MNAVQFVITSDWGGINANGGEFVLERGAVHDPRAFGTRSVGYRAVGAAGLRLAEAEVVW